ncbi:hypothetical protein QDW14_09365 [Corynebacterium bovis]|uniref:hypothetical protein n=1 Tax=Corynebacterium bovis TaxID=36808 RepID=UPI0024492104|nr:hypothetical protein [Corynebacterium bovis]MDH2456670.1 hypothetical protein [Corynebacterium bovis]
MTTAQRTHLTATTALVLLWVLTLVMGVAVENGELGTVLDYPPAAVMTPFGVAGAVSLPLYALAARSGRTDREAASTGAGPGPAGPAASTTPAGHAGPAGHAASTAPRTGRVARH